ncbi:MAG: hypothetical protein ACREBC_36905 [Pyrinomonadaceae bacterium]
MENFKYFWLDISEKKIRCTTVPGFQLEIGAHTSTSLKEEIQNCEAIIGILTENSLDSMYVMFELGAGWGLNKRVIPVLGPKFNYSDLRGPLSEAHGMKWNNGPAWHQLIDSLSQQLNINKRSSALFASDIERLVAYGKPKEATPAEREYSKLDKGLKQIDCSQESALRSTSFDTKTLITFRNETSRTVKVYWIDYEGDRISYGTLKPRESRSQQTFLTHPFVLTDLDDKCIGIFLPTQEPAVAILKD